MDMKLNKKIEKNIFTIIKMLGYIISHKYEINVKEHKIISFDILHKTNLNIFVVDNNGVLYINNIVYNASKHGHVKVLEWYKNSFIWASLYENIEILKWFKNNNYIFKYDNNIFMTKNVKIIYFLRETIHLKKIIKYCYPIKSMKFKTKNNYIKGYNEN
jgi:hypothetical protein